MRESSFPQITNPFNLHHAARFTTGTHRFSASALLRDESWLTYSERSTSHPEWGGQTNEFPIITSLNQQLYMHAMWLWLKPAVFMMERQTEASRTYSRLEEETWWCSRAVDSMLLTILTVCNFAPLVSQPVTYISSPPLLFSLLLSSPLPLGPLYTIMPIYLHGLYLTPDRGKVMCSWLVSGRRRKEWEKWEQRVGWGSGSKLGRTGTPGSAAWRLVG